MAGFEPRDPRQSIGRFVSYPLVAVVHDTAGGVAWLFVIYAGLALFIAATASLLPGEPAPL